MSVTVIDGTMQAQTMQGVQRMQADTQAPMLSVMTFNPTDSDASFYRIMQGASGHADQLQQVTEQQQAAIDMDKSDDLAGAMIASQQVSFFFSVLMQVRNKIATGFNGLTSMSI